MDRQRVLKHTISLLALMCLIIIAAGSNDSGGGKSKTSNNTSSSKQWFQGGNLHKATVTQWKSATYQNKLATASDWLAVTKWKGHLNSPGDFDRIKVKAQMLVGAIDKVVAGKEMDQLGSMKVNEISASIVTMSNDLGP